VLALLAGRVRLDSFKKVKEAISNMVAELVKQQKDEADHKDWCDKSMNDNTKETKAGGDKKDSLTTKRDNLKKNVETLIKKIDAAKTLVAETKEQMKKASETREAANADYQQTITDQRMTQMILRKAIDTLKSVYALVQYRRSRSIFRLSSRHGAAPKFKKYAKNAKGAGVVKMLEDILKTSKKSEADAIKAEQSASTTYETFMIDSNKALAAKAKQISTLSGNMAKAKEDLIATKKDLASTNTNLDNLASELTDLKGSCDFIIDNFKVRQDARSAETDALKEAMSILSGAK
jgi:DNA repair exonuclease SbcCD ATPase subunit